MTLRPDIPAVVRAVHSVVGPFLGTVALHEPEFRGREREYVDECIRTGWVSSAGRFVDEFERRLEALTGARRAVAAVNGTAALHACLLLAGVKPGDEVILPALTFVATANAVAHAGAVPHLADSEERTLGIDPAKLSEHLARISAADGGCRNRLTGRRIAAVVPMHTFGHPVDLDGLDEVCRRFGIPMVEDAAEALGSTYRGRHVGTTGLLSALSFNGNKIVTTGGGGAILTNDDALGREAKHLTTTAKLPHPWLFEHDRVGFNYRMPNLNAALGVAQLERLDGFVDRKRRLAGAYRKAFEGIPGVRLFEEPEHCRSNYWLNALLLEDGAGGRRDELLSAFHAAGILARPAWTPMHRLPMYTDCPRMDLSTAEDLERRIINLPSSAGLSLHVQL